MMQGRVYRQQRENKEEGGGNNRLVRKDEGRLTSPVSRVTTGLTVIDISVETTHRAKHLHNNHCCGICDRGRWRKPTSYIVFGPTSHFHGGQHKCPCSYYCPVLTIPQPSVLWVITSPTRPGNEEDVGGPLVSSSREGCFTAPAHYTHSTT
ncbi:hypothetical protein RRG08_059362 [Elysia crispata]|uniref:Uncharacterized protein n=1 Tax=Elysia crispata TaxID=231223 RepID=A0AAE1EF78_9GAST|nr:hypothetical protein RRG08_059362 [Elysia crispata]